MAGRFAAAEAQAGARPAAARDRARALLAHITGGADAATFQPMNVNFGLFPPLPERSPKSERRPSPARARGPGRGGRPPEPHAAACDFRGMR